MREWWRGAVIYQIWPSSFRDGSGDGIGDLPGLLQGLDHIASLGVDAIWITPFFKSPMKDSGYDVEDYNEVDPLFGSNDDFDRILEKAHSLGIKVILDIVLNHTASTHKWFLESRRNKTNSKADWYIWADPKPDGSPPNNWLAIFGGPAWQWEPRRSQYYMHQFLVDQPDLNIRNPEVQDAVLGVLKHWLDKGVDGIRLDACNHFTHDDQLRDNPSRDVQSRLHAGGVAPGNPYQMQWHIYDRSRPENLAFVARIRKLVDGYGDRLLMAEVSCDHQVKRAAEYIAGPDRLHTSYSFALLDIKLMAENVRRVVEEFQAEAGEGWPSWAFSNHDVVRVRTRWGGEDAPDAFCKMASAVLVSLRGSVILFQGEELGLGQADVPFERMLDPYGIAFYPEFKGRDGCRTPLPWDDKAPHAGFSTAEPQLPIPAEHLAQAVSVLNADAGSVLNFTRRYLGWRKAQPAMLTGAIRFLPSQEPVLVFERQSDDQRLLFAFNLGGKEESLPLSDTALRLIDPAADASVRGRIEGQKLILPPYGLAVVELTAAEAVPLAL